MANEGKQCGNCDAFSCKVFGAGEPVSGKCFGWLPEVRYVEATFCCERWKPGHTGETLASERILEAGKDE